MSTGHPHRNDEVGENGCAKAFVIYNSAVRITNSALFYNNGFKKTNDKKIEEFDVRFSVKIGNAKYYINRWFDVVNVHHDSISVNPRVIYLLRQYSGFYNYIESEDLVSPDIKLYGIPKNYQYMYPSKKRGKKVEEIL